MRAQLKCRDTQKTKRRTSGPPLNPTRMGLKWEAMQLSSSSSVKRPVSIRLCMRGGGAHGQEFMGVAAGMNACYYAVLLEFNCVLRHALNVAIRHAQACTQCGNRTCTDCERLGSKSHTHLIKTQRWQNNKKCSHILGRDPRYTWYSLSILPC